ncbi:MAG TPA: T9SS type A sorting domain-containing protein [Candidatus Krumholzibacteria bacterium]|nr:T9SS type A sorting domain-containing protein [Candidatus Krumholzibacteria bacterium]
MFSALLVLPSITNAQWVTDGTALCTQTGDQKFQRVVSDGTGGAIVAWEDLRGSDADIYVQRIDATGSTKWTTDGVAICTAIHSQFYPMIVSDGAGGAIVAWIDARSGDNHIYAQRVDGSGVAQWTTDGEVIAATNTLLILPVDIVSDTANGAIITWLDHRNGNQYVAYVQRIDKSGVVQWTADGVELGNAGNDSYANAHIVEDGSGGAIISWPDDSGRIQAQGVTSSGNFPSQWPFPTTICSTTSVGGYWVPIVTDGAGGAIIAWEDNRNYGTSHDDIYAQRVDGNGYTQWTTNGVPVTTWDRNQEYPGMVSDGAGGALIAWEDTRFDPTEQDWDIFMQRINGSGVVQWAGNDAPVSTEIHDQGFAGFVPDGSGGAVITWSDNRDGVNDIYAQRVDSAGQLMWEPVGVAVCKASNDQESPYLEWDGSGGIVTWYDKRNDTDYDVYAQWVSATGGVAAGVHDTPSAREVALSPNFPNPFSGETTVNLTLPREEPVTVDVFDVAGRRVREINEGRLHAGATTLAFDGRDNHAHALPSGVYFYRVHAGSETVTRKMLIEH